METRKRVRDKNAIFKLYDDTDYIMSNLPIDQSYTFCDRDTFKMIVISDTHFGSKGENLIYLNKVKNYASKHNIKYIVHCGDLIEGLVSPTKTMDEQINFMINEYLSDDDFTKILLLGNHEASLIMNRIYDLEYAINECNNINTIGYKCGHLKIADRYVKLRHQINRMVNDLPDRQCILSLYGHSHKYGYKTRQNGESIIKVPTLSDSCPNGYPLINIGFLVFEFNIQNNKIVNYTSEFIDFNKNDSVIKEVSLELKRKISKKM